MKPPGILRVNAFVVPARTSVRRSKLESYSPNWLLQTLQEIDMGPCTSKPSVAGSPARYASPPQSRPRHLSRRRHRAGNRLLLGPVHCARLCLPQRVVPLLSNRKAHPIGNGQDGPPMRVLAAGRNTRATIIAWSLIGMAR
ncbi:hypothetical protein BRN49_24615 [Xanthomonas oryzae pv. oryzae]|nr:hypothetical protein BRN49_24615 [Xanthomonas oryzae pv. oryzae]